MEKFNQTRNILVAVDVQNDFINGSLAVAEAEQVVAPLNAVATTLRERDDQIIFTRDWHPAKTPHFAEYGGEWPVHCMADTDGAAFHPDLNVEPSDIIINKGTGQTDGYSAWEGASDDGQTLKEILAPNQHEKVRVFIGGLATDFCVKATAIDIANHFGDDERVQLYLIRDAVRAVNLAPGDEANALAAIELAGVSEIYSQDAIDMIERSA